MKVSLIQMSVAPDKAVSLRHAGELVKSAACADIIMLPEMFCCPYSTESFRRNAEPVGGPVTQALLDFARETGAVVIGGSFPESDGGRIYNTCLVTDAGGIIARHRKAHLFDIDVRGGQRFRESDTFTAGSGPTVFSSPAGKSGVCVCFDVRFPEFICKMRGVNALFVPAAFNMTTGPLHWELLFRARAVDLQAFTFGCAPARDERGPYVSYGNSIAVSPWGRVIARAGAGEEVLTVEFDPKEALSVRRQIPVGNPV